MTECKKCDHWKYNIHHEKYPIEEPEYICNINVKIEEECSFYKPES
jgi:hypothetical protein